MIEYKRVFIDTAPFIYYLEQNLYYFEKAKEFFLYCYENDIEMITSTITIEEYFVYPYKSGKLELINNFQNFISSLGIRVINIDKRIANQAAMIRAEFKDFKSMDALQIATAIESHCDVFLTNDKQLRQEKKIECITLDEWN